MNAVAARAHPLAALEGDEREQLHRRGIRDVDRVQARDAVVEEGAVDRVRDVADHVDVVEIARREVAELERRRGIRDVVDVEARRARAGHGDVEARSDHAEPVREVERGKRDRAEERVGGLRIGHLVEAEPGRGSDSPDPLRVERDRLHVAELHRRKRRDLDRRVRRRRERAGGQGDGNGESAQPHGPILPAIAARSERIRQPSLARKRSTSASTPLALPGTFSALRTSELAISTLSEPR